MAKDNTNARNRSGKNIFTPINNNRNRFNTQNENNALDNRKLVHNKSYDMKHKTANNNLKMDGIDNDPDVQFNANLLNVTGQIDEIQHEDECKEGKLTNDNRIIFNTNNNNNNNKIKDDKNVLLLKSIYPNRPKVIFFQ